MQQKKQLFIIVGFIIAGAIIIWVVLYNRNNEIVDSTENIFEKEEVILREKNVSEIVEYAFSDDSLQYTARVAFREVEGNQNECIVVEFENVDSWNQLLEGRRVEIMEGLINTSRLQIDREFGCVIIESLNVVIVEGFWRDVGGYVIIEK